MFPSPPLLLVSMLTLLAATPVCAVDLFSFRDAFGRILAFTVPDTAPIPATVDQAGATQAAIDWPGVSTAWVIWTSWPWSLRPARSVSGG